MEIRPVQKQMRAGQRTRFKAFVAVGDFDGHLGLGAMCAKEVATAIRAAIDLGASSRSSWSGEGCGARGAAP